MAGVWIVIAWTVFLLLLVGLLALRGRRRARRRRDATDWRAVVEFDWRDIQTEKRGEPPKPGEPSRFKREPRFTRRPAPGDRERTPRRRRGG